MRSIGRLAVVTGTLVLASACSDGGGGTPPPDNEAPVANFNPSVPACTINVPCALTDASTDDVAVTGWSWDFNGDGNPDASTEDASYTYTAAGTYTITLTVTDEEGLTNAKTATVTIAAVPPVNTPPTAGFTYSCTAANCTFTNTSTDAAPGAIASYLWNFGEPASGANNESTLEDPTHAYTVTAPASFTVTLTVTDNEGATDVETHTVSVSPPPNTPPTAGFTHACNGANCIFTSTSTDVAPGAIASYGWTFGDGASADVMNPLHSYVVTAPTDFTVTLTVTDNEGATDVETHTVSVSPPPPGIEGCTTSGTRVDCFLNITARSTVKLKLIDINCDLRAQRVTTGPPIWDQVFLGVCSRTVGEELGIFGGPTDQLIVFEAGSQVPIRFSQGIPDEDHPVLGSPAAQLVGTFPNWTINFEDGANPGGAGEPDFTDVVLGVQATVVP